MVLKFLTENVPDYSRFGGPKGGGTPDVGSIMVRRKQGMLQEVGNIGISMNQNLSMVVRKEKRQKTLIRFTLKNLGQPPKLIFHEEAINTDTPKNYTLEYSGTMIHLEGDSKGFFV